MATRIVFDINKFNRFLSVYEQSQAKFAGKKALTKFGQRINCLLYTSPSPRDKRQSRMPSSP